MTNELVEIGKREREALLAAVSTPRREVKAGPATLRLLLDKGLAERDEFGHRLTDLGRYQVRWNSDECAALWAIEVNTWHQYVRRGTAPAAVVTGKLGSSVERPWWDPQQVTTFQRPTSAHNAGQVKHNLDAATIVRQYRGGTSIRALAKQYGTTQGTVARILEGVGAKPETTATRAERERRMAGNNPTPVPSEAAS